MLLSWSTATDLCWFLSWFQEDEEDGGAGDGTDEKKDPTHFSELDPKTMKVAFALSSCCVDVA